MTLIKEKLRNIIFWTIDFIRSNEIKNHYQEIKFILENYNSPQSEKRRAANLTNLLDHATKNTTFYSNYINYESLNDFPVINKAIIRAKINDLQSKKFKNEDNYKMTTSGSSGTPFTTMQNKNKKDRNTADTIYFKKLAGYEIGDRIYYIRKWFDMHKKNKATALIQNIAMIEVTEFSDDYLSNFIKTLENDRSTKSLIGYSSALREICTYLDSIKSEPIKTKISCIIAMSEALSERTKNSLEKYFNAPVLNRYSNLENGIISMQLPKNGPVFHINWASYYVEILHPLKDIPVKEGELGRVVVSDLFNYCMPFIRYDTGDLAIMSTDNKFYNHAPVLSIVEGRKMDIIYDTKGKAQSTYIIFHLESYPELQQFQFIQQGEKHYILKLNVEGEFNFEEDLRSLYKSYLGDDAIIEFQYVNEIPQLSSGKRRLTINNYI